MKIVKDKVRVRLDSTVSQKTNFQLFLKYSLVIEVPFLRLSFALLHLV